MTLHVSQSVNEFHEMIRRHGCSPIEWLRDIGFLAPDVILGHAIMLAGGSWTQYAGDDIGVMAGSGCFAMARFRACQTSTRWRASCSNRANAYGPTSRAATGLGAMPMRCRRRVLRRGTSDRQIDLTRFARRGGRRGGESIGELPVFVRGGILPVCLPDSQRMLCQSAPFRRGATRCRGGGDTRGG